MEPTDASLAVDVPRGLANGSFWGDVHTAAAYAEDTVHERDCGGEPVLLAILTETLEADCAVYPDLATVDFPLEGLTRLGDPGVRDRWNEGFRDMDWRDGLRDLGAIVATHDLPLSPSGLVVADSLETVKEMTAVAARPRAAP